MRHIASPLLAWDDLQMINRNTQLVDPILLEEAIAHHPIPCPEDGPMVDYFSDVDIPGAPRGRMSHVVATTS